MRCKPRPGGFTLIELLVAISILAIVAVLGWRGLDSLVKSRVALNADLAQTRALQLTFAQLQSDCAHIVNPLNYPNLPEGRSSWIEPQRLILLRNVYVEDQAPAMQIVTYRLIDARLNRFESVTTRDLVLLNQLLQQARNPPDQQVEIVMQREIADLSFEGYPLSSLIGSSTSANQSGTGTNSGGGGGSGTPAILGSPAVTNLNTAGVTTGLQVTLQLVGRTAPMQKIFLLGGI